MNIHKARKRKAYAAYTLVKYKRLGLNRLVRLFNIISIGEVSMNVETPYPSLFTGFTADALLVKLAEEARTTIGITARSPGKSTLAALNARVWASLIPDQIKRLEDWLGVGWSSDESCKYRFIITYRPAPVNKNEQPIN